MFDGGCDIDIDGPAYGSASSTETLFSTAKFDETRYRYLEGLRHTKFKDDLCAAVETARISLAAKHAVIPVINAYFDETALLSDVKNPEIPKINLEISLLLARTSYNRRDIRVPDLLQTENLIRAYFSNFSLPRMCGKERERLLAAMAPVESRREIISGPPPGPVTSNEKKSGPLSWLLKKR